MKRLSLNHSIGPSKSSTLSKVLLMAGVICSMLLLTLIQHINNRNALLELDIQRLQRPSQSESTISTNKTTPEKQEEINAVKNVLIELSIPWQKLFKTLEGINSNAVKLISVEPNAKQHKLRIAADTTDINTMLEYVSKLSQQSTFDEVLLVTHEFKADNPMPVSFIVEALWN